jgi:MYXO-CTERM domain-containing protein
VVFVYAEQGGSGGACTGTIVKTDPASKIAWVLTAAHCVDIAPVLVIQGNDFMAPSAIRYTVLDYASDPQYSGTASGHDFAVVRVVGASAQTPLIPITASPDGLQTGSSVVSVGYGRTTPSNQPPDSNTIRRVLNKSVAQLDSGEIVYSQTSAGICQGDSGGPVLFNPGGGERVVGVHSYVQGYCTGSNAAGVSQRVTSGLTFINQQLAKAAPPPSCDLCLKTQESGTQACAVKQQQCFASTACKDYYDCMVACTTSACRTQCATRYPLGEGPLKAVLNCSCQQCTTECAGNAACSSAPQCGYLLPGVTCRTCTESSCCAELQTCSEDGQCYVCLKGGDKEGFCATNVKRQALLGCQRNSCATKCFNPDGGALAPGEEPPPEETPTGDDAGAPPTNGAQPGATTTTITESGCAASPRPASRGAFGAFALLGAVVVLRRRRRS